jgi:hypothetical protein
LTPELDALPEAITAPRTDAIYNCHAYPTKVPVAAIRPFIETFTAPGETVVDFFAGPLDRTCGPCSWAQGDS